jgi:hypothetical protein
MLAFSVPNEEYAAKIARDWNVPHSSAGYVTRFHEETPIINMHRIDLTRTGK